MTSSDINTALSGPCKSDRFAAIKKLDGQIPSELLTVLIDIEAVETNLVDYRNKERYLENLLKLAHNQPAEILEHVVHYLMGSLYINFERFWGPTIRVITELLNETKYKSRLLTIIIEQFRVTNDFIYNVNDRRELPDDRPDYILHRNFTLQILAKFPSFVESKHELFMDEVMRFVKNELMISPFIEKLARQDLTSRKEPNIKKSNTNSSKSKETFITMTRIIQSFQSMILMHRHQEFREFILNLMTSRDASMQKAAFNCITAYDTHYLRPYAEKILKLLDDEKIRGELSMFSIDCDTGQIDLEHRKQLIPIIHRILFGRMVAQVGKKTSGREKADKRKSTVMKYIAGCTVEEIISFFELLFEPVFKFVNLEYDKLKNTIEVDLNMHQYVPLNKLQAMLTTLSAFLGSVANLKPETLPVLLKIISIITVHVVKPLEDLNLVSLLDLKCIKTLKILKRNCLDILTEYFKSFPFYKFSQLEIDFVFDTLIWPSTRGFVDKNHATVTPILKLIDSFMENEVYHRLVIKRNKVDQNEFLLNHIMILYNDKKIERPVSKFVVRMICNLLKLDSHDDTDLQSNQLDNGDYFVEDNDAIVPTYNEDQFGVKEGLNLGYKMIMPYIPRIFDRLQKNCEQFLVKNDVNYRLENSELCVLSALSQYIKNSDHCLTATRLLLSTLEHQKNGNIIVNTVKTAQTLMKQVNQFDDPQIINFISNTLFYQRNTEQRKELCNLVEILATIDSNMSSASMVIKLMNAYNEDFVDTPDLVKWNEGFDHAFKYLEILDEASMNNQSIIKYSLTLLLHQVGYIINTIDKYEFSIRENCLIFYERLAPKLNMIYPDKNGNILKQLLSELILEKFIKKGLRDSNDSIKHTYIGIIRILAVDCHERHPVLNEFFMFCNSNQDLDFWINIKHIQLHCRSKALARLISNEDLQKVSTKTLSSYFMPIANGFLFNKSYKSVASLSDNSIKLIGIICSHLNWNTYESTLSYYLDLLTKANTTYQRTNIKLITEVLKNFNFDLTACDDAMLHEEENKKLENRMMRRCGIVSQHIEKSGLGFRASKKLNPSTARMVYNSITNKLIPKLNSCLHEMTRVDFEYDKNMSDYMPEKDEIKRIPMAFAIVQLLSLLPGKFLLLRDQLPPLFLKLTTFLRSKNEPTRRAARATLLRIMTFIGPAYIPDMIRVLRQQLDKGFYIHVLNYTVHSVLEKLILNYGDLDSSVNELLSLCKQEIFGRPSEDKEISQILAKTSEAKKTKSYDTLLIISSYISVEKLDLLTGFTKDLLRTSTDPKTINKLSVCLQRIFTGLSQNSEFPLEKLIIFIQDSIEKSVPNLKVLQKFESATIVRTEKIREDRFLISNDKTKDRVKSKINEKGNLHMVVENSLRLLLLLFEKNKSLIKRKESIQQQLDGLISLLTTCLKSSSPRCIMRALKCLYFIAQTKIGLPSFKTKCDSIIKKIFILLSVYNGVGMAQGDNYEMIGMCFKTLTLLLLTCEHVQLNEKQVRALMSYIEQDINDTSRQATAFKALNSLLHRRCVSPNLADIMNKVGDLLLTSSDDAVRLLSTKIWQTYLLEYQHDASVLQTHLGKFIRQIDYEFIDGRRSVLKMLQIIVEKYPEQILQENLELFFHLLAQRLVNDDSKEIREIVGRLIALLLQRLPENQPFVLNKFVFTWASENNMELKTLGVKLLSVLLETNQGMFDKNVQRLNKVLTIINESAELGNKHGNETSDAGNKEDVMETDENISPKQQFVPSRHVSSSVKLVYHSLRLFKRLLDKQIFSCTETRYINYLKMTWMDIAKTKLTHWFEPIVSTSCELYLEFITQTTLDQSLQLENPKKECYLDWNATRITRILCDKFIELSDRYDNNSTVFTYSMQSLILLGGMVANSNATKEFERKYIASFDDHDVIGHMLKLQELPKDGLVEAYQPYPMTESKKKCDLMWLSVKMVMQARKEAALFRLSEGRRRDLVLRWTAAIAQILGSSRIGPYIFLYLMTPVRELTDKAKIKTGKDSDSPLMNLLPMSDDLLKFFKGLTGVEQFNKIYSKIQLHYTKKRVNRKKNVAIAKVREQVRGTKRKIDDNKKKQSIKKKRIVAKRKAIVV